MNSSSLVSEHTLLMYLYAIRDEGMPLHCILYPRERGPMGGAPYIRLRLGGGRTFVISPS